MGRSLNKIIFVSKFRKLLDKTVEDAFSDIQVIVNILQVVVIHFKNETMTS